MPGPGGTDPFINSTAKLTLLAVLLVAGPIMPVPSDDGAESL